VCFSQVYSGYIDCRYAHKWITSCGKLSHQTQPLSLKVSTSLFQFSNNLNQRHLSTSPILLSSQASLQRTNPLSTLSHSTSCILRSERSLNCQGHLVQVNLLSTSSCKSRKMVSQLSKDERTTMLQPLFDKGKDSFYIMCWVFLAAVATLYRTMSVCRSVCLSVGNQRVLKSNNTSVKYNDVLCNSLLV